MKNPVIRFHLKKRPFSKRYLDPNLIHLQRLFTQQKLCMHILLSSYLCIVSSMYFHGLLCMSLCVLFVVFCHPLLCMYVSLDFCWFVNMSFCVEMRDTFSLTFTGNETPTKDAANFSKSPQKRNATIFNGK